MATKFSNSEKFLLNKTSTDNNDYNLISHDLCELIDDSLDVSAFERVIIEQVPLYQHHNNNNNNSRITVQDDTEKYFSSNNKKYDTQQQQSSTSSFIGKIELDENQDGSGGGDGG